MSGIFKTYDIRGIYPDELNEEVAYRIGRATPLIFPEGPIGLSRDMRLSALTIHDAVLKGLLEAGLDVVDFGLLSTPMNYFAVGEYGFRGGIQVTASHNPAQYIGFKFNAANVVPVTYEHGLNRLEAGVEGTAFPPASGRGKVSLRPTVPAAYRQHVQGLIGKMDPYPIVVDAGNGMGCLEFPTVFSGLPPAAHLINDALDGRFPHHDPNPLKPENWRQARQTVAETKSALGVIFDGDADRIVFFDERGTFVPTDFVAALIAGIYLRQNPGAKIVCDFRVSWSVEEYIRDHGGIMIRSRVGHTYIKEKMRETGAVFGGDIAGHYYFRENYFAESTALVLARILELLTRTGKKLSELHRPLKKYYSTGELNYPAPDKEAKIEAVAREFQQDCRGISHFDGVTIECRDWRLNVRASNTEPLIRFMAEAKQRNTLKEIRQRVERILLAK